MMTILVVDDSAADRRLVAEFLKEDPDLEVEYAVHGADALAKMEEAIPDLVVTDLMMPQMDGLDLVVAVRSKHPLVPVILVTCQGNEQIATRALQQGAASYVPKRALAQDLLETVHRVLAVSGRERRHARRMGCMTKSDRVFVLDNDCTLFGPLVSYLQDDLTRMGLCGEAERTRIGVALEEALANALYHGNLALDPELRGRDERAYCALLEQRPHQAPYRDRRIHVEAKLSRDEAVFVIRDEGDGFDPSALPDPTDPANLENVSGRGVLLMRTFMDEVVYNDVGNTVTLTKYRDPDECCVMRDA
jgi:CheY-like chemotaxis protein/anti-sigma regulatory factor (Ser/Thr protein kinase)